ncbi:unnamed protein product [Rhizophagus irregularis]|nr:unnamed protein product [Rhizophagus irregularis]CAB5195374.1 unnamed protein product [Rhizophagus irregularis]
MIYIKEFVYWLETNEEQNSKNQNPTKIIESSDIGLVPKNNPDNNDDGQSIKRKKLYENENNDYFTKFIELDIDMKLSTDEYITQEYDFDI